VTTVVRFILLSLLLISPVTATAQTSLTARPAAAPRTTVTSELDAGAPPLVAVPVVTGSTMSKDDAQRALDFHNRVRREVGTSPLTWSVELAAYAQQWANHLAGENCRMQHRPPEWDETPGENLFSGGLAVNAVSEALASWYAEKQQYRGDPITLENFLFIGHYTQMVWNSTREFGIGLAPCTGGSTVVVANYKGAQIVGRKPY